MKRLFPVCVAAGCLGSAALAGPVESAIMAAMRLSDQPNYTWVATISDDARTYDVVGRTTRGGFTRVTMPVINSVRRQLGRSVTDTQVEFIFQGNVACVVETEAGWARPDELSRLNLEGAESDNPPATTGHAPLLGGTRSTTGRIHGSVIPAPRPGGGRDARDRAYSNLQLALSHPHEELGVIVSSHVEFKVEGDVVTGTLSDRGAQLLLVRDGQDNITPLRASGTFKLWIRDGMVTKFQVRLEGTLTVQLPSGRRQINVTQYTDTVVKDVGTTVFEVPTQARVKLGG